MASIEPYNFREKTNLQEHNDIISKVNEIVDVINNTDLDTIGTRLTNDESQIAVNTAGIKANTTAIDGLIDSVDTIDKTLDTIEPMVSNHETDIANLKVAERRLSNDVVSTYTLYRNGEGKIKAQMETVGGTLIDSNTLDMIIPYQYDIISGTTDRSFKLNITMSDGSSYTTNDFVIPDGGGSEIVVTGITLSKDSTNVNRFHVGINLSDSTMIDSGYISMVDNVVATYADSKLTISVNGVSSVPISIVTAGNGITITDGVISIDDTIVALKSVTDSLATQINECATGVSTNRNLINPCFNNVSISGQTLKFTKVNGSTTSVDIPNSGSDIEILTFDAFVTCNLVSSDLSDSSETVNLAVIKGIIPSFSYTGYQMCRSYSPRSISNYYNSPYKYGYICKDSANLFSFLSDFEFVNLNPGVYIVEFYLMASSSSLEEYIGTVGYIQIVVQGGMVVHISSPYASTLYSQYPLNEIVSYSNYVVIGRITPSI